MGIGKKVLKAQNLDVEKPKTKKNIFVYTKKSNCPLISVIVPVYEVEKYINKCLDSIVGQTYKNLEILLIDDGTQDRSGDICEEYAKSDLRIKVFHKENGGLSDARNYGLERASGEYLTFVDADDFLDSDYIEYLYSLIEESGCRLSLCSLHVLYTSSGRVWNKGNGKKVVINGETCIEMMCYHEEIDTAAYAKLCHRSLFEEVRYPKGKIFEDIGTSYLLFDQCEKIICSFIPKYYYVIRDNSIVTSSFNKKKLDFLDMTDQMADYVDSKYPDLLEATLRRRGYARFSTLNQMIEENSAEHVKIRQEIIRYLRKIGWRILGNSRAPKRDKIAYMVLYCGYPVYKFFWKIYIKYQRGK